MLEWRLLNSMKKRTTRAFCIGLFLVLFFFCPNSLFAQNAVDMDALLDTRELTYAQAAQFVLPAAGVAAGRLSEIEAFRTVESRGWIPENAKAPESINAGSLSLLIMKSFDLKGGLMYTLFPSPRYAYRELQYRTFIQGNTDPRETVSGAQFLHILGRVLKSVEGDT
jgi:hypothetical protein